MKVIGIVEKDAKDYFSKAIEEQCKGLGNNVEYVKCPFGSEDSDEMLNMMLQLEKDGGNAYPVPEICLENNDAEIAMGQYGPFGSNFIEAMPELRVIGLMRAGLENVDLEKATERGVAVFNATGRNANAVSDFTVGMLLAECRNIARSHHDIMDGKWLEKYPNNDHIPDLFGKTVGIFGFGYIGKLVAEKLSGFHVNLLVYDPFVSEESCRKYNAEKVEKEDLFRRSDFVTIHSRYTEETYHTVGKAEIDLMKPTAFFINTARAGLVDYDALLDALENNRIAGAALDVYYEEPLEKDSPFLKLKNVTLTPHVAGATQDAETNSAKICNERIVNFLETGSSFGLVNPEVLKNEDFMKWAEKAKKELGR